MPIKDIVVKYRCEICKYPYQGRNSRAKAFICEQTEAPAFKWKVGDVLQKAGHASSIEITELYVYPRTHKAGYKAIRKDHMGKRMRRFAENTLIHWDMRSNY